MKRKQKKVSKAANGELKIEHNVPLPTVRRKLSYSDYMRMLKPKDSIVLPTSRASAEAIAHRILGKGHYLIGKETTGTRIWRLK